MASVITNTCPRGGFFDGNENFGGPPYRGFMALLCFAPSMFLFLSAAWWYICYRKQRAQTPAPIIQNGNLPQNSNYQTMNDNNNNNNNNNNLNIDLSIDDHPMIDDSLYYSSEPNSPHTSSSVGPMSSPSPQPIMLPAPPTPSPLPSSSSSSTASNSPSSSNTASMSASLLTPASPSPSPYNASFAIENNNSSGSGVRELGNSRVSRYTRFLLFCRSLIRPSPLYMSTCIYSCIQFIITLSTLVYAIVVGEQCCYGGTGALYAILCLRLCLSYTNIRIGYWQTNSRYDTHITVIDKSCQIGYLIHFIWLAFAFILVADDGQCSATAPVMYTVSYISIILLLLNYSIFALFTILSYVYHSKNDMMIVLSRTAIKFCLIGWAYGKELDLNDAITDIEMEIACLPCVTYDEMMQREKMKKMRRQMYDMEKNGQLTVKIDKMSTNNDTTATDAVSSSSSSSTSSTDVEVETLSCAICLSAYETCDMIRPLPCGHHLHKSCSDSWLKVKSTCPLCVRSVLVQ